MRALAILTILLALAACCPCGQIGSAPQNDTVWMIREFHPGGSYSEWVVDPRDSNDYHFYFTPGTATADPQSKIK